jgi:hypothetical protein
VFTPLRLPPFYPDGDWRVDGPRLHKWLQDYFLSLEKPGALSINEVEIFASQGIQFPATQVASTDANTLDDYEEGTWTPADGSGAGLTFTVDHARYTKVGRLVTGQAKLTYPATVDGSGAQISGLPFASANETACAMGGTAGNVTWGLVSTSSIYPEPVNSGGVLNSALTGATLWFSFAYTV